MRSPITWLIIALVWAVIGIFFYWSTCPLCAVGGVATKSVLPLLVEDGSKRVAYAANDNLLFGLSNNNPIMSDEVKGEYKDVADYMKANPKKNITLTGLYKNTEKNTTSFKDLGLARADALKKYMVGLGVPAASILTASAVNNGLNLTDGDKKVVSAMNYKFGAVAVPEPVKTTTGASLNIADGGTFKSGSPTENILFAKNGFEYKKPLPKTVAKAYDETADYLKKNPKRSIKVVGLYGKEEKNTSLLPNLGLARANNVKRYLLGKGVAAKQIETKGEISSSLTFKNNEWVGPMRYEFFNTPATNNRLAEIEKSLKAKPLVLYFATGKDELVLSKNQRQYFADLIYYMDQKPTAKVISTGHTDSVGKRASNVALGQGRADFVKDYLVRNGAAVKLISTASKGPDKPIASNETKEGRAKNRRVEISVK